MTVEAAPDDPQVDGAFPNGASSGEGAFNAFAVLPRIRSVVPSAKIRAAAMLEDAEPAYASIAPHMLFSSEGISDADHVQTSASAHWSLVACLGHAFLDRMAVQALGAGQAQHPEETFLTVLDQQGSDVLTAEQAATVVSACVALQATATDDHPSPQEETRQRALGCLAAPAVFQALAEILCKAAQDNLTDCFQPVRALGLRCGCSGEVCGTAALLGKAVGDGERDAVAFQKMAEVALLPPACDASLSPLAADLAVASLALAISRASEQIRAGGVSVDDHVLQDAVSPLLFSVAHDRRRSLPCAHLLAPLLEAWADAVEDQPERHKDVRRAAIVAIALAPTWAEGFEQVIDVMARHPWLRTCCQLRARDAETGATRGGLTPVAAAIVAVQARLLSSSWPSGRLSIPSDLATRDDPRHTPQPRGRRNAPPAFVMRRVPPPAQLQDDAPARPGVVHFTGKLDVPGILDKLLGPSPDPEALAAPETLWNLLGTTSDGPRPSLLDVALYLRHWTFSGDETAVKGRVLGRTYLACPWPGLRLETCLWRLGARALPAQVSFFLPAVDTLNLSTFENDDVLPSSHDGMCARPFLDLRKWDGALDGLLLLCLMLGDADANDAQAVGGATALLEAAVGAHGIPTADEVRLALIDALLMLDRAGVEVAHRVAAELRQKCSPALPPSRLPEEPSRVAAPVAIQGGVRVAAQNASALLKAKFMGEVADLLLSIKVALQKADEGDFVPLSKLCVPHANVTGFGHMVVRVERCTGRDALADDFAALMDASNQRKFILCVSPAGGPRAGPPCPRNCTKCLDRAMESGTPVLLIPTDTAVSGPGLVGQHHSAVEWLKQRFDVLEQQATQVGATLEEWLLRYGLCGEDMAHASDDVWLRAPERAMLGVGGQRLVGLPGLILGRTKTADGHWGYQLTLGVGDNSPVLKKLFNAAEESRFLVLPFPNTKAVKGEYAAIRKMLQEDGEFDEPDPVVLAMLAKKRSDNGGTSAEEDGEAGDEEDSDDGSASQSDAPWGDVEDEDGEGVRRTRDGYLGAMKITQRAFTNLPLLASEGDEGLGARPLTDAEVAAAVEELRASGKGLLASRLFDARYRATGEEARRRLQAEKHLRAMVAAAFAQGSDEALDGRLQSRPAWRRGPVPLWAQDRGWMNAARLLLLLMGDPRVAEQPSETRGVLGELNREQITVVTEALFSPLSLLRGPPGTGKTRTLLATLAVVSLLERAGLGGPGTVLVTTETNHAADHFVRQSIAAGLHSCRVLRKQLDGAEAASLHHTGFLSRHSAKHECVWEIWRQLLARDRRSKPEPRMLAALRRFQLNAREDAFDAAEALVCTTAGASTYVQVSVEGGSATLEPKTDLWMRAFRLVIVDEATQMGPLAALVPLTRGAECVVLGGDPRQLQPMVSQILAKAPDGAARVRKLEATMFTRFIRCGAAEMWLTVQYRMHERIAQYSNALFYGGSFVTANTIVRPEVRFGEPLALRLGLPHGVLSDRVVLLEVPGPEQQSGSSKYHSGEVDMTRTLVQSLLRGGDGRLLTVAVISPYKAQVGRIKEELLRALATTQEGRARLVRSDDGRDELGPTIKVDTTDAFQGQEADVLIVSTVRRDRQPIWTSFAPDPRRINVSLTRAKSQVVVLGERVALDNLRLHRAHADGLIQDAWSQWVRGVPSFAPPTVVSIDALATPAAGRADEADEPVGKRGKGGHARRGEAARGRNHRGRR